MSCYATHVRTRICRAASRRTSFPKERLMFTGSCHCGVVRFEIKGEVYGFRHCHCRTCRKIHGTVFGSSALTSAAGFTVTAGEASLERYESSPGKRRCFCKHCGSHVFAYYEEDPSVIVLRLGGVGNYEAQRRMECIWVSYKVRW